MCLWEWKGDQHEGVTLPVSCMVCLEDVSGLTYRYCNLPSIKTPSSLLVNLFLSLAPGFCPGKYISNQGLLLYILFILKYPPHSFRSPGCQRWDHHFVHVFSHNTQKNTCFIREYCVTLKNIGCSEVGSTCQCRRRRFHPLVEKIPWRRKWQSH